jgi:hypothetical protein
MENHFYLKMTDKLSRGQCWADVSLSKKDVNQSFQRKPLTVFTAPGQGGT